MSVRMRVLTLVCAVVMGWGVAVVGENIVTITYWQYEFKSKVEAIDKLIKEFEAENPGIKVRHETFPYAVFAEKVATAVPAGVGPHIVNLYYGWMPVWIKRGYLQALPEEHFPAQEIEQEFVPMVQAAKMEGRYWGLPTAVRTLALFYNTEYFEAHGIAKPPETWDELIDIAKKLTVRRADKLVRAGFSIAPEGQDHHLLREVLVRQFGGRPYSDDGRTVTYHSPEGAAALRFYTDLVLVHKIGDLDFPLPGPAGYRDGFMGGLIGMIIDGSFAIGTITRGAKFKWAVAELPRLYPDGPRYNFGSFWMHSLTPLATGKELEASIKFLKFITSARTMEKWLEWVGELPARLELIDKPELLKHPVYGPFIAALPYSHATVFVDEAEQRRIMIDAVLRVIKLGMDPAESLRIAAEAEQAVLDRFWAGQ